jgi:hypothetical protein
MLCGLFMLLERPVEEGQERKKRFRINGFLERADWYSDKGSVHRPAWTSGEPS